MPKAWQIDSPTPPPDGRAAYYQLKAEECQQLALCATDPAVREEWLQMANQFTLLYLRAMRGEPEIPQ